MPTLISESRWWKNWNYAFPRIVILSLIAMLVALLGYLFSTHTVFANRHIGVPQTTSPTNPPASALQPPAASQQQAQQLLEQVQKSLEEVKRQASVSGAQIDEVRKELDEARKQTDRTDKITTTFISIYTILVALLAIDGLLSRTRLKEALQKVDDALAQQVPKVHEQMDKIGETAIQAQDTLKQTQEALKRIESTRTSLFEELPKFIRQYLPDVFKLNDPLDDLKPADLALLDEIDHLTFLANAGFRFRKPETPEERNAYIQSLMATVRGYLVQRKEGEVVPRVNFLLKLLGSDDNTDEAKELRGRTHTYAAQAHYRLLVKRSKRLDLQRTNDLLAELEHHRKTIAFHLANARKRHPRHAQIYVVDALYRSNCAVDEWVTNESERSKLYNQGQREAIDIYRALINDFAEYEPNVVGIARQNLCCCLKRLADESGQYDEMFQELESYPAESEILSTQNSSPLHKESTSSKLWQSILIDSTFFNSLHVSWNQEERKKIYEKKWAELLRAKLNSSSMEKCYAYFRGQSSSLNGWTIKPWQSQ
jgi:hypothetical protein